MYRIVCKGFCSGVIKIFYDIVIIIIPDNIGPSGGAPKKPGAIGNGMKTLRLKNKGQAVVEDVRISSIRTLINCYMTITLPNFIPGTRMHI